MTALKDALMGKRVLITGATGFVGANLVRISLSCGAEVHIVTRTASNRWRLKDIFSNVKEHCCDLSNYSGLRSVVSRVKPEIVYHTAAYGGDPVQRDFQEIIRSNFTATANLLNACKQVDFELFVNTGSSSEYGIKLEPMGEGDLLEPNNDYGASKAAATLFCQAAGRREGLPIVTLRLFSPYGYYEERTRLVPHVIMACLNGKNPKISSTSFVRDFVFIEDVLNAYLRLTDAHGISGKIFNVGYGKQHSVGEVVDKIIELTGNNIRPEIGYPSKWQTEPERWQAEISTAKVALGWEPQYDLERGLTTTLKWFQKNMTLYS